MSGDHNMYSTPVAMPTLGDYYKSIGREDQGDVMARQVGGDHYHKGAIQPWTIGLEWGLDPWSMNVVKYILRFPYKNGVEDLEKIKHYVEFLIENYDTIKNEYYE